MDGLNPEVYEVWTFGEDSVTPEVHAIAQVDVGAGFIGEFTSNYLTADGRRIPIFDRKSINGSVEWLGVPAPVRTYGASWADNILFTSTSWGASGTATNSN